jgi:hypothetical protein
MLDTFSKDIVYKELPPPYTQTLFIELIRFIPGQPDTVLPNGGGPSHPSTSSSQTTPHQALNGNAYNPRALPHPTPRATPHSYSPPHHQIAAPGAHMPPPPPWEVKWRRPVPASASAPPPPPPVTAISVPSPSSSVRRLSTSSSVTPLPAPAVLPSSGEDKRLPAVLPMTPPSASRKRKYPEGDASVSAVSPYGSPSCKTPHPRGRAVTVAAGPVVGTATRGNDHCVFVLLVLAGAGARPQGHADALAVVGDDHVARFEACAVCGLELCIASCDAAPAAQGQTDVYERGRYSAVNRALVSHVIMVICLIFFLFFFFVVAIAFFFLVPTHPVLFFLPLVVCALYLSILHDRPDRTTNHVFSFNFHVSFFCFEWRYIYVTLAERDGKMCSVA